MCYSPRGIKKLFVDKDWSVLVSSIPQENLEIKSDACFECDGDHYRNKCQTLGCDKDPARKETGRGQEQSGKTVNYDNKKFAWS